jgi:hypothetical protein
MADILVIFRHIKVVLTLVNWNIYSNDFIEG